MPLAPVIPFLRDPRVARLAASRSGNHSAARFCLAHHAPASLGRACGLSRTPRPIQSAGGRPPASAIRSHIFLLLQAMSTAPLPLLVRCCHCCHSCCCPFDCPRDYKCPQCKFLVGDARLCNCTRGVCKSSTLAYPELQLHKRGMQVFRRETTLVYTALHLHKPGMQVFRREKNTCIPGVVIAQMGYASFPARNNTCIHGAAIAQAVQPSLPPRSKACIHGTSGVCKSSGAEQYLHTRRCNCMGGVCQFSDNLPARPIKFAGA